MALALVATCGPPPRWLRGPGRMARPRSLSVWLMTAPQRGKPVSLTVILFVVVFCRDAPYCSSRGASHRGRQCGNSRRHPHRRPAPS